jgi:lipopolysaccharide/colanic/teichoic acid biosynthesis glycosyltransferase
MYKAFGKRAIDLFLGVTGFILLLPVFLLVTIILAISNRGSAFFFQTRPGKDKRSFKVIKFKTMNDRKNANGYLLPDADRLTGIGNFLRKTSLDEIPQLLNVIKADMSLVGPRPLLMEYVALYNKRQARRNEVKPGITGWAQVNGRNAISWEQKFEYDVWYIDNISFKTDLKILWMTISKVFKHEGINSDVSPTMEKFTGTI